MDERVFVDSVEEIGLLIVVGGKDDIIDDSLQSLEKISSC